ncbi:MAG: thiamine pyrophosphate-binding protein [Desulfobacterales bacterium]|nr:thiamine pyrophosphate-binding protein [Desulfobacterales bacterium]
MQVKVADYIADWLAKNKIKHVFTVTGGGAMHLNNALGHHTQIACIYNHHEQASAMAAEGYYKTSGKLPAVCVTSGPGGTNAITGAMGAWLDSVPMFIISGQVRFECTIKSVPDLPLRQVGDQEFNITDTVKSLTKYAVMVTQAEKIKYHLEKALFLAVNGRPGPVWLDIPLDVQAATLDTRQLAEYDPEEDKAQAAAEIPQSVIDKVIEKVRQAKRPALIAGSGIRLSKSEKKFRQMAKQLNIPVMTAWNSHDLLENANPLYAGRPGTVGTRGGNFVFQNCDLLLVIGCRMNLRQIGYRWDRVAPSAYKIMVDIDKAELQKRTFKVNLPVQGDCKDFIEKIIGMKYRKKAAKQDNWIKWCRQINSKYTPLKEMVNTKKLNPYAFCNKLFQLLPEKQVTITSNGAACVVPFQVAEIKKSQRLFTNSGCASMGYGLPAAIGGCVAIGRQKVVCLEGDGSIQMNIQELQTVMKHKLPLKIFVINNNGYHSIRQTQHNFFESKYTGIDDESGVSFPDLGKIARAYGLTYYRIKREGEIEKKVTAVMESESPVLCEVVMDTSCYFTPRSASKILPDGKMVSTTLDDMYPFLSDNEMTNNRYT